MQQFDPPLPTLLSLFPQYGAIARIGAGGQKVVYRAENRDGSVEALKLIPSPLGVVDERGFREAQAAGRVHGPTFATIYGVSTLVVAGQPCVIVREEFIDGSPLRQRLTGGPQPLSFVRQLGDAMLTALTAVEAARLVHRDVKPENIMLGRDGRIILIDFGIARHLDATSLTSSFDLLGPMTIGYCAPEQITNQKRAISIRTDLFALGVVLYELLTGANPFTTGCTNGGQAIQRCLTFTPLAIPSTIAPPALATLISLLLEKSPHRRPASVAQLRTLFNSVPWE